MKTLIFNWLTRSLFKNTIIKTPVKLRYIQSCLLLSIFISSGAWATAFSNLYVFGDSLSDTGNVSLLTGGAVPNAPYYAGRLSNGPNYVDDLGAKLGFSTLPSLMGGTNYANGGARTDSHFLGPTYGILGQVNSYVSSLSADPNALYIVFGGANDIQDAIAASINNFGAAQSLVTAAVNNIDTALRNLANDGAKQFLVPNTPDLAMVPRVSMLGITSLSFVANLFATQFNTLLDSKLNTLQIDLGVNITRFDTFSVLNDVVANPGNFGITNVTDPCYTGDDQNFTGGGTVCSNPDQYAFWDTIHPTAQLHQILANGMARALQIPEPDTIFLLISGLIGVALLRMNRIVTRQVRI
ncbi:SGNH/GDSL hydrolase family protein [Sulfurirhabdus autotrophica]|uniref:Putative secreted protein with PEP-CTERM sorting signal n=1 Tax=Sulfurirhabdus autotrophica TaxID=1706046 RepID=A0A4R3Y1I7_9PROT|nr:SGNH/GDSL hydrolase family protein [Sulfurirhabdus autotrophica]TCV85377.1 putative secreted protein with PEP-CTERM sorting signal [Sulfurirhabdus autotrophica]